MLQQSCRLLHDYCSTHFILLHRNKALHKNKINVLFYFIAAFILLLLHMKPHHKLRTEWQRLCYCGETALNRITRFSLQSSKHGKHDSMVSFKMKYEGGPLDWEGSTYAGEANDLAIL